MTMNCQKFARMLASDELAEVGLLGRFDARLHLLVCRYCQRYAAQLRALGAWARRLWEAEARDPERLERLENRILERFAEESAGSISSAPGRDATFTDPNRNENEGS